MKFINFMSKVLHIYNLNQVTNIIAFEIFEDKEHVYSDHYTKMGFFSNKKVYFKDKKFHWVNTDAYFHFWYDTEEEFLRDCPFLFVKDGKAYRKAKLILMFSDGNDRTLYFYSNEDMYKELEKIKSMMTRPEALYYKE